MNSLFFPPVVLIFNVFFLFIVSRLTIDEIFGALNLITKNKGTVYWLVSLIFFPGTTIHELAHFFMATILLVRVREFKIFPEWQNNHIKLGFVSMEKRDFLRGILIGIAPIFAGFGFFWFLSVFKIFPNSNLLLNAVIVYLIFCISTMMFSSREDLKELINTIPILILVGLSLYIFNVKADLNLLLNSTLIKIIKDINIYLFYSLIINIISVVVIKSLRFILKK